jgi:hypothetical protein
MIELLCAWEEQPHSFFNQNHSNEWSIIEAVIEVLCPFKQAAVMASNYNYDLASNAVLVIG